MHLGSAIGTLPAGLRLRSKSREQISPSRHLSQPIASSNTSVAKDCLLDTSSPLVNSVNSSWSGGACTITPPNPTGPVLWDACPPRRISKFGGQARIRNRNLDTPCRRLLRLGKDQKVFSRGLDLRRYPLFRERRGQPEVPHENRRRSRPIPIDLRSSNVLGYSGRACRRSVHAPPAPRRWKPCPESDSASGSPEPLPSQAIKP